MKTSDEIRHTARRFVGFSEIWCVKQEKLRNCLKTGRNRLDWQTSRRCLWNFAKEAYRIIRAATLVKKLTNIFVSIKFHFWSLGFFSDEYYFSVLLHPDLPQIKIKWLLQYLSANHLFVSRFHTLAEFGPIKQISSFCFFGRFWNHLEPGV